VINVVVLEPEPEEMTAPALLVATLVAEEAETRPDGVLNDAEEDGVVVLVPGLDGLTFVLLLLLEIEDCGDEDEREAADEGGAAIEVGEICDEECMVDDGGGICDEEGELLRVLVEAPDA